VLSRWRWATRPEASINPAPRMPASLGWCWVGCPRTPSIVACQRRPALLSGSANRRRTGGIAPPAVKPSLDSRDGSCRVRATIWSYLALRGRFFMAVQQPRLGLTQVDIGQDGQWPAATPPPATPPSSRAAASPRIGTRLSIVLRLRQATRARFRQHVQFGGTYECVAAACVRIPLCRLNQTVSADGGSTP